MDSKRITFTIKETLKDMLRALVVILCIGITVMLIHYNHLVGLMAFICVSLITSYAYINWKLSKWN
jgi:energy-converting hydrogenase Eha subunit E